MRQRVSVSVSEASPRPLVLCRSYASYKTAAVSNPVPQSSAEPPPATPRQQQCVPLDMADVARGIKTAVLRAQTATPAKVPVENAPDEGRRASGEYQTQTQETAKEPSTESLKSELCQLRVRNRADDGIQPLRDMIKQSGRALKFARAGKSFSYTMGVKDQHLVERAIDMSLSSDLQETIPRCCLPETTAPAGPGVLSPVKPVAAARRPGKRDPWHLMVDLDPADPEYEQIFNELCESNLLIAASLFKPVDAKSMSTPRGRRPRRSAILSISSIRELDAQSIMANLGNDITTIEEGEEDDKERIRTAVDAEQSVYRQSIKFDTLKLNLCEALAKRVSRFDTDRSVSARTRMEASDRRFQYKSSARDMNDMRYTSYLEKRGRRAERRKNFKKLAEIYERVKGTWGTGDQLMAAASVHERTMIRTLAGFIHGPHGADITADRLANLLVRLDCDVLVDDRALKVVYEFMTKIGISDAALGAAITSTGRRVPNTLLDICNVVKTQGANAMFGMMRSTAIAGRLLRKQREVQRQRRSARPANESTYLRRDMC